MKNIVDSYLSSNEQDRNIYNYMKNCVIAGNNKVAQTLITESMKIDMSWIQQLDRAMDSIEKIAKNPKSFMKEENEVVPIERAKSINGASIRHLSAHTNYIRNIDEIGDVQPSKILTSVSDINIAIYENKFVYALVLRLNVFLKERYDAIKKQIDTIETTEMQMQSAFDVGFTHINYDMRVKLAYKSKDVEEFEFNRDILTKLEIMMNRLKGIRKSQVFEICSKMKVIKPPIMKTNLLIKNIDYKNCYNLWLFISAYRMVGFSVAVGKKELPVDNDYFDDLTYFVSVGVMSLIENNKDRKDIFDKLPQKTKKAKNYKLHRTVNFEISSPGGSKVKESELINQYYYDKIKELLEGEETKDLTDINDIKNLRLSFKKFYKNLSKINTSLCEEVLRLNVPKDNRKRRSIKGKEELLVTKKNIVNKYDLIVKSKEDELAALKKKQETAVQESENLVNEIIAEKKRLADIAESKARIKQEKQIAADKLKKENQLNKQLQFEQQMKTKAERNMEKQLKKLENKNEDKQ
ncbi:MAG: hypothetical protein RR316_00740 [Clostridia bacterium]